MQRKKKQQRKKIPRCISVFIGHQRTWQTFTPHLLPTLPNSHTALLTVRMPTTVAAFLPWWLAHRLRHSPLAHGDTPYTCIFCTSNPGRNKAVNSWVSQLGPNKRVSSFPSCRAGKTARRPVILYEWRKEKYGLEFFLPRLRTSVDAVLICSCAHWWYTGCIE